MLGKEGDKRKIRDTKIGQFLADKAPLLFQTVADLLPNSGTLGIVKNLIGGSDELKPGDKVRAVEMTNEQMAHEERLEAELTARHAADMASDSFLSKNIRPMTLAYLLIFVSIISVIDAARLTFTMPDSYIKLFQILLLTVFGFYFGSRGLEKLMQIWKK